MSTTSLRTASWKTVSWRVLADRIVTGVFAAFMALSAVLYLTGAEAVRESVAHLGYPPYLLLILGPAKLIGVAALLQRRFATLREWSYAGFAIDLVAAAASHQFAGDPFSVVLVPVLFLIPLGLSYVLGQASQAVAARRVATLTPRAA